MNNLYISKFWLSSPVPEDSYIAKLPVVKKLADMGEFKFKKNVTFFVGENGCGKSTLLEALAVRSKLNAEGGSRNYRFSTCSTESDLCKYITIAKSCYEKDSFFLRAESFYNVSSYILEKNLDLVTYGGKSLHDQSHGESFIALIQNRFWGNGLYILDEPESALSPLRQISLLVEIDRLVKKNSQLIIATHSPILTAYPEADIYEIDEYGVTLKPYEETSNYLVTKQFLCDTEKILRELFDSGEKG